MKKLNFAICDLEASYACKLMDYITEKQTVPFEVLVFSEIESLRLFTKEHQVELLLISARMMCPEVRGMDIQKLVILSEGEVLREYQEYPAVYKYQASDSLVAEVMNYYASQAQEDMPMFLKRGARIIGIYSPVARCGKTCFALTLGQILAREEPVLYLNLETYAGFERLMERRFDADITDVCYFVRQSGGNVIFKLNAMVRHLGDLAYVPPALSAADLSEVQPEEWSRILDAVTSVGGYETVILDMGGTVEERLSLLSACTCIYTPICGGSMAKAKVEQYERLLREMEYEELLDRTSYLQLPFAEPDSEGEYFIEQLVNGKMGVFVRDLLQKEKGKTA